MKILIRKIKYIFGLAAFCWVSSCDLQEANINPNAVTEVGVNVMLPATQANMTWAIADFSSQSTSSFLQYMAGTLNVQLNITIYDYLPVNFQSTWTNHFYAGAMKDLDNIIQLSTESGALHYRGVAKVQMAMLLGYLVDLWGDVPYSQALDLENYPRPVYDSGEALYEEIQRLLDQGIEDLEGSSSFSPATNDLIFPASNESNWRANSRLRWIQAAKSAKARYYNHLSKIDPMGSAELALEAIASGTFESNDSEMKVSFGNTPDAAGPWHTFLLGTFGQNNISVSQEFIDLLVDRVEPGVNDPRLEYYISRNPSGEFVGTPIGDPIVANRSFLGPYVNSASAMTNLITYKEVKFIEAESHYRLGNFDRAAEAFNEAVKASILRVTGSAHQPYEDRFASETGTTIQDNGMQKIFTEKYIAMFLETEAWADWRRSIPAGAAPTVSGIPELSPAPGNPTNNAFPRRFLYPTSELDNNAANIPETSRLAKVFWDL
ncbi:SusD/RagB family nutrient-binding outer membrane lipoprotein [Pleomorphovibrio marinus]|uniref:SusD/RagB family nutrient-binding outer membrane lipoprotein n=1 Tax=Pleomorphovibrio marinus TaxID=2164132 RepID=UPI000E0B30C7|nr:SusD/RagB family nutrient-binding outer membrane lipoprotein [Pleomorphovibrio marinus]